MATETVINRPAPFVEDIGKKLSEQALGLQNVPVVTTGIGGITRQAGETDAIQSKTRCCKSIYNKTTKFSRYCTTSCRSRCIYNNKHKARAQQGVGSFQPFLQRAEQQAGVASGLGAALGQLGTAGTTIGGVP